MRSDWSQNRICEDPPIWVFDDLLSEEVLQRVDSAFEDVEWKSMNGRQVRIVELNVDSALAEIPETLRNISHIEEVAPCHKIWIMDVQGRDQGAHMDGWEVEKSRYSKEQLDLSKCSVQTHRGFSTVIPTLSFVIYFNDVGGCSFPKADLPNPTIPAKRGRILMFHNYVDSQRPAHNPSAIHHGVYGDGPKRVMTAGVLSDTTPSELLGHSGVQKTRGLLYAPIMHRSNTSCGSVHDYRAPSPPRAVSPPPKQILQLFARKAEGTAFIVEATAMSGTSVAKVMLQPEDTLGTLRRSLPDATLVVDDEILEGDDEILLQDTALVKKLLAADETKIVGLGSCRYVPKASDVNVLVEWDVIDTVFA